MQPLLPQYRGAAPINWAVINGEKETGVTTFFLDHDIDTGRIILQKRFPIPETENVEYVYDGLMHLGAELALETIDALIAADGNIGSIPQSEMIGQGAELKPAPKIFKDTCASTSTSLPSRCMISSAVFLHTLVHGLKLRRRRQ